MSFSPRVTAWCIDIYTDYLQVTFRGASATGLSDVLDRAYSHDQITRLLSSSEFSSKDLWHLVKPLVRSYQHEEACLIFDDSIIEKPYTDESGLITWHFDHSKGKSVKGIGLLTAFYHTQSKEHTTALRIPVGYELIRKPIEYCEIKTRKHKRMAEVTKNEQLRRMMLQCIRNDVVFRYVLGDSWFAASENMEYIHDKKKVFIFDLKANRLASTEQPMANKKKDWTAINEMELPEKQPVRLWLKDLKIQVLIVKQTFKNEYHKSIKQNAAIAKSPTKTLKTQANHIFVSLVAYVKFEKLKFATHNNHFALKSKLYLSAVKAAFKELYHLQPPKADCVM